MIPGVCQKKGQTYRRFRYYDASGKRKDQYVKLPNPTDPNFAAELARVNAAEHGPKRTGPYPGSFGALARDFRAALMTGWTKKKRKKGGKALSASTVENYLRYVSMFEDGDLAFTNSRGEPTPVRDMDVAGMRPTHVYRLRDSMADKPGKANNWLNVLKLMLTFATERDWRADNPAAEVTPLPIGEHEPWPADILSEVLEAASPMLRLAIVTLLCSGQRISDGIRIQHNWLRTDILELSQLKTNVEVAIVIHPWWREEITKVERKATTVLYDRYGRPFDDPDPLQERIRALMKKLGHVDEGGQALYTFHGLRKNACCYLLEAGNSDSDVGYMLGMTAETVRHYGKRTRAYTVAARVADNVTAIPLSKMGR